MRSTYSTIGVLVTVLTSVAIFPLQLRSEPKDGETWNRQAAADYLDQRAAWWTNWPRAAKDHETVCISCHTALPYALGRPALRTALGEKTLSSGEQRIVASVTKRVKLWNEVLPFYSDAVHGKHKTAEARGTESILNALILVNYDARAGKFGDEARQAMDNMWVLQLKSDETKGAWSWLDFHNEPWEAGDSQYWGSTLAAIAIGSTPKDYQATPEVRENVNLLKEYLQAGWQQQSTINRTFLLWASTKVSGLLTPAQQSLIVADILSKQLEDGGWSTTSVVMSGWKRADGTPLETRSDGFGTGLAAFALQRAGVTRDRPEIKQALAWLERNQDKQGLWPAYSLNKQREPSADAWLFMTDAATAYSVLALTDAAEVSGASSSR